MSVNIPVTEYKWKNVGHQYYAAITGVFHIPNETESFKIFQNSRKINTRISFCSQFNNAELWMHCWMVFSCGAHAIVTGYTIIHWPIDEWTAIVGGIDKWNWLSNRHTYVWLTDIVYGMQAYNAISDCSVVSLLASYILWRFIHSHTSRKISSWMDSGWHWNHNSFICVWNCQQRVSLIFNRAVIDISSRKKNAHKTLWILAIVGD